MGCLLSRKEKSREESLIDSSININSTTYVECQHCQYKMPKNEYIMFYGHCKKCREKL